MLIIVKNKHALLSEVEFKIMDLGDCLVDFSTLEE